MNETRYESEFLRRENKKNNFETISIYKPNFIECANVEQANKVNMKYYRLLERLSANMQKFIFVKRQRK